MMRFIVATILDLAAFAAIYHFFTGWILQFGLLLVTTIIVEFITRKIFKDKQPS